MAQVGEEAAEARGCGQVGEEAVEAEVGKEAAEERGCDWVRTEECAGGCRVWTRCNIKYQ
jgi:hypothetical protein